MKHPETACVLFAGRLFDFHVLDMIELGIEKFSSLSDIKVLVSVLHGSLPALSPLGWAFSSPHSLLHKLTKPQCRAEENLEVP